MNDWDTRVVKKLFKTVREIASEKSLDRKVIALFGYAMYAKRRKATQ